MATAHFFSSYPPTRGLSPFNLYTKNIELKSSFHPRSRNNTGKKPSYYTTHSEVPKQYGQNVKTLILFEVPKQYGQNNYSEVPKQYGQNVKTLISFEVPKQYGQNNQSRIQSVDMKTDMGYGVLGFRECSFWGCRGVLQYQPLRLSHTCRVLPGLVITSHHQPPILCT